MSVAPNQTVIVFDLNGVVLRLSLGRVACALWQCPHKWAFVRLAGNGAFMRDLVRGIRRKQVLERLIHDLAAKYPPFATIQETAMHVISAQKPRLAMVNILEQLHARQYMLAIFTNIGPQSLALLKARYPEIFERCMWVMHPVPEKQYCAKPSPTVFADFKQLVGDCAHKIIFIDDTERNNEQARASGMVAVPFKGARVLIRQLKELMIL